MVFNTGLLPIRDVVNSLVKYCGKNGPKLFVFPNRNFPPSNREQNRDSTVYYTTTLTGGGGVKGSEPPSPRKYLVYATDIVLVTYLGGMRSILILIRSKGSPRKKSRVYCSRAVRTIVSYIVHPTVIRLPNTISRAVSSHAHVSIMTVLRLK